MVYQGKKLTKFEKRISLDVAAKYFADLTGEEVDLDTIERLAFGRIPLYCTPRQTGNVSFFVGFYEDKLQEMLACNRPDSGSDESMRTAIDIGDTLPTYQFVEDELPFPLVSSALGYETSCTPTNAGDIYWFIFSPTERQLVAFSTYDVDATTITVSPKDVYQLAIQANSDDDWPENDAGFCTEMVIRKNNTVLGDPDVEISSIRATPGTTFYGLHELQEQPPEGNGGQLESDAERGASAYLVISGMIKMITGMSNKTQGSIQEFIAEEFGGVRGTSESKLQKLFAKANAAAEEARKE